MNFWRQRQELCALRFANKRGERLFFLDFFVRQGTTEGTFVSVVSTREGKRKKRVCQDQGEGERRNPVCWGERTRVT